MEENIVIFVSRHLILRLKFAFESIEIWWRKIKIGIFSSTSDKNRFQWFLRRAKYFLWLGLKGFLKILIFSIRKNYHNSDREFAHFCKYQRIIHDQICKIHHFLTTSDDRNSSPRWSWVMFKHTGTMYSSRYVDSRPLKCPTTNLRAPNRARKLTAFGQNPRSGACTTLPIVDPMGIWLDFVSLFEPR